MHSLLFCFAFPQDHLVVDGMLRLYVAVHQVVQASIHIINKFSPLISYLDLEATMTTHKLIKNVATVKAVLPLISLTSDSLVK